MSQELIQNADDAGANEVKILFDATSYGTSSLVSAGLASFQGPALYCYNNAEFTEDDWEGLQRLMRSNKQNNPLKVGRFGIGFNSVYHITGNDVIIDVIITILFVFMLGATNKFNMVRIKALHFFHQYPLKQLNICI